MATRRGSNAKRIKTIIHRACVERKIQQSDQKFKKAKIDPNSKQCF